ncbi:MAG: type I phosphomannose isomerase catalytic subunit [Kiritimatiellia bacterium]
MNLINEPLVFKPVYKNYLWGGTGIAELYRRYNTPAVCAESWEISAHPDGISVVAEGSFKGRRLDELVKEFSTALIGTKAPQNDRFPLLCKIIDAKRRLSVQVHPNNGNAELTNGQPKTEMWYVLGCDEGASLFAGLKNGASPESVRKALNDGGVAQQLVELKIAPGQALFIPGGLIHAIGDGCMIYEVQQNSNTTYRMFDWNRTDAHGNARELHIEQSLKTIDWKLPVPEMIEPQKGNDGFHDIVSCEFFTMRKLDFEEKKELEPDGSSFICLFAIKGDCRVEIGEHSIGLKNGSSALIPAYADKCVIESEAEASVLVTTL